MAVSYKHWLLTASEAESALELAYCLRNHQAYTDAYRASTDDIQRSNHLLNMQYYGNRALKILKHFNRNANLKVV